MDNLVGHGYAPGDYFSKCSDCGVRFSGDKRAYRCHCCAQRSAAAAQPVPHETLRTHVHVSATGVVSYSLARGDVVFRMSEAEMDAAVEKWCDSRALMRAFRKKEDWM